MKYFFLLLLLMCGQATLAHKANRAYFNFIIKENIVEIEAELPWTMRNALLDFNPQLENSTSKQDFEATFIEYIKKNLILRDSKHAVLEFVQFKELPDKGHSHQNNYLIVFKGKNLFEVTNSFMLNLYKSQVNYNRITTKSMSKTYETKRNSESFILKKTNYVSYWYLLILIIPLAFLIKQFLGENAF